LHEPARFDEVLLQAVDHGLLVQGLALALDLAGLEHACSNAMAPTLPRGAPGSVNLRGCMLPVLVLLTAWGVETDAWKV
jgi:hypothetical protein